MKWLTAGLLVVAAILAGLLLVRDGALGAGILNAGGAGQPQYGTALDEPKLLPDIALTNAEGQSQSLRDSGGKMRLVFYGFVRCPDVCPATMNVLTGIYEGLTPEQQQKLSVQMVSVDPTFDTPTVLREYLDLFDPAFVGLTGETADIDRAAAEMFVGISRPAPTSAAEDHSAHMGGASEPESEQQEPEAAMYADEAVQAAMLHGDQVSVVDTAGNFVRVYGNRAILSGELEEDVPALLAAYGL